MLKRSQFLQSLFLPMVSNGSRPVAMPPTEVIKLTLPDGYTAHLENPQVVVDGAGVYFCATRPNSGVGGLVWKQFPDGTSELALPINPDLMYALGEFQIWPDGYLRYTTVQKEDHTFVVVLPVPGWTPWPNWQGNGLWR